MAKPKQEVISFKADPELSRALAGVPNRSEFIRQAVSAALEGVCPLCQGTGSLTSAQRRHWESFTEHHRVAECGRCHALHLVCGSSGGDRAHG
jgi:hypothetical protein